jgi:tetratricopeptide (TPR) repeat protein
VTRHVGELALLRFVVGDVVASETESIGGHVAECARCHSALNQIRQIDRGMQALRVDGSLAEAVTSPSSSDPFSSRPRRHRPAARSAPLPSAVVARGQSARALQARLLAVPVEDLPAEVAELELSDTRARFGLLYALQDAGRRVGEGTARASALADAAIRNLRQKRLHRDGEAAAPLLMLWAQAHVLAGQCLLWSKNFERAGVHLRSAYRAFGRLGDETGLAIVELNEAQRRALAHDGESALVLARRARATFADLTLEDLAARALVAEGLAYFELDRQEDAVGRYREALPIFQRCELWGNWIGTLNSLATSLNRIGRFDEARSEYARALRRFSTREHRAWRGFLLDGLAEVLFRAGKYRDAAAAYGRAARAYADSGLIAHALMISAAEVESWIKAGEPGRARDRLELIRAAVARETRLEKTVLNDVRAALASATLGENEFSACRRQLQSALTGQLSS